MTIGEQLKGKDINIENIDSSITEKQFFDALKTHNRDKIRQCINKGIDVNVKDSDGWAALMHATDSDDYKTVRLLVEFDADIDVKDDDGQTPLMNCAFVNARKSAEFLISHGANVNLKDKFGQTALMLAALNDSKEVGEMLILNGADIDAKDNEGMTAYEIAAKTWGFKKQNFFLSSKPIKTEIHKRIILYFFDKYFLSKDMGDVIDIQPIKDAFAKKYGCDLNNHDFETYFDECCKIGSNRIFRILDDGLSIQVFPSNKEIVDFLIGAFDKSAVKEIEVNEFLKSFEGKYNCQLEEEYFAKILDSFNFSNDDAIIKIKNGNLVFFDLLSDDVYGKRAFCDGHSFNLDGGDLFNKMGATWFVSYSYYQIIDKKHEKWSLVSISTRTPVYDKTKKYHKFWLKQVLQMSWDGLSKNEIGVPPAETKRMAKEILIKIL